jgi:hypothetical protein
VNRAIVVAFSLSAVLAFSSCTNGSMGGMIPQSAPMAAQNESLPPDALTGPESGDIPFQSANPVRQMCPAVAGEMECFALLRTDVRPMLDTTQLVGGDAERCPFAAPPKGGYCPDNLQDAYKLPSLTAGKDKVVAIVDAFGYTDAASDLAEYRSVMGLPPCKTSDNCLRILNQEGKRSPLPRQGSGSNAEWVGEESVDLDMVSAICPRCKIVLIQTDNNITSNLYAGEKTAGRIGAKFISNSWGGGPEGPDNAAFHQPGVVITAAAGDDGGGGAGGPQQPCSYTYVVCVGGTHLVHAHNARGWDETVWNELAYDACDGPCGATGSGCSTTIPKPGWQTDHGCKMRSEADVSATASVHAPVIVYNTELEAPSGPCTPPQCFWLFGGTSVATPIIAATFALAGNPSAQNGAEGIWKHHADLYNVTMGDNIAPKLGTPCASKVTYICHARRGFSGPVGWGTPHGINAF